MNIDELSGAELDALAAQFMGFLPYLDENGEQKVIDGSLAWLTPPDANGRQQLVYHFCPSCGEHLNDAANAVLLKALGEGYSPRIFQSSDHRFYWVRVYINEQVICEVGAPTLPLALVRAICKAVR